jgi:hypothetical protein
MEAKSLPPARFEGVVIYPDPEGAFEIRYPLNWHKFEVTQGSGGILFSPYPDHQAAWVAVWKVKISKPAYAADRELIRQGLDEGLLQLGENVQVVSQSEEVIGNLLRFERIVTFTNQSESLKRRHWLFFAYKHQINLVYQAREAEYSHWSGMAYYSFHTFRLPEHLWFATDAERGKEVANRKKGGQIRTEKKA